MESHSVRERPNGAANGSEFGPAGPMRTFDVKRLGSVVHEIRRGTPAEVVVIIPLYNYARTIAEALESVADQDIEQRLRQPQLAGLAIEAQRHPMAHIGTPIGRRPARDLLCRATVYSDGHIGAHRRNPNIGSERRREKIWGERGIS